MYFFLLHRYIEEFARSILLAGFAKIARTIQNMILYYLFIFAVIQSNTEDILFLSSVNFRDFKVILVIVHH